MINNAFPEKINVKSRGKNNPNSNDNYVKFQWTGHPFVDAGLAAILIYVEKENPEDLITEDIERMIEFTSKLYVGDEWSRYLTRIYRNNNPILMLNPSMKRDKTSEKLKTSLIGLFNLSNSKAENTKCQICGKNMKISGLELRELLHTKSVSKPKEITGDIFPLLSSGELRNFFPLGNPMGADICAQCLFLSQLMPIGSYAIQNKKGTVMGVLSVSSYPYDHMIEIIKEAVENSRYQNLFSNSRDFKRPENFFFRKIVEITRKIEIGRGFWKNTVVTLYYFLNGNRGGEQRIRILNIPTSALNFVAFAAEIDYDGWKNILNMGWFIKNDLKDNKSFKDLEKGYSNKIYEKLLNEESILNFFSNSRKKKVNAKWRLLEFYCLEVLDLDQNALDFIKDVGDRIVGTIEPLKDNKLRKTVRELENSKRLYQFENFFIRLEKIRQTEGLPDALLSFDEFSRLLTQYGEEINFSWHAVKNLLLFRIYEKLHNRLIKEDLNELKETDDEIPFGGD